jgi:hypothetical protein
MQSALVPVDQPLDLLILLLLGHLLADYSLQSDKMAVEKCPGKDVTLHWSWWFVSSCRDPWTDRGLVDGRSLLGLAETLSHAVIDFGKCRLRYPLIVDQALHWACKVLWVIIVTWLDDDSSPRLSELDRGCSSCQACSA